MRRGGLEQLVVVDKAAGAPLGLELASAVFDRVRTCDNHCPFCFIYQLPKGMRRSLYVKDDDYRLSFLYGNFTTLTRFTEADLERVITEQLGPLYVSIHATDPELRTRLLRNRRGATSLRWLSALLDARHRGARPGGRVPGRQRRRRARRHAARCARPLPAAGHRRRRPARRERPHHRTRHAAAHARARRSAVLDIVDRVAGSASTRRSAAGSCTPPTSTTCSPGARSPTLADYDELPQHENGIGMAAHVRSRGARRARGRRGRRRRGTRTGFFAWVDGAPAEGYRAPRRREAA